ncbi:MAG: class I adenylate-forming enzyme family protein [Microthrixaceae bacterium]
MPELIAVDLPGGPAFVDALLGIWDRGDAALPLDPRAPRPHTDAVLAAMRPAAVIGPDGATTALAGSVPVEPGDAVVVTTSGTTGAPKGVVHTHDSIEQAAFATSIAAGVVPDATWLACLPLSHVGGLSVVTRALRTGAGLVVHDRADPTAIDRARRAGATHVSLVPTLLARIDPTGWHTILLGGSAIPADRPSNSIATYGMTETFGGVVYDGLALAGVGMRIDLPPHSAHSAEPVGQVGPVGPIELRSPSLLRAYRDGTDPHGVDPVDRHGWLRTGDLGSIDPPTGRLTVMGRADDLIISGGEKVWPGPVEQVLREDPRVREVAVIGRADREWGQRVVAIVVPSDPGDPPTLDALRGLAREWLPVAAAPKELELVDSLPRTALGKIRRSLLSEGPVAAGGPTSPGAQPERPHDD